MPSNFDRLRRLLFSRAIARKIMHLLLYILATLEQDRNKDLKWHMCSLLMCLNTPFAYKCYMISNLKLPFVTERLYTIQYSS